MPLYTLDTQGALHPPLDQEWLLTNGLGSYAQGTVVGCNTRRYHGLLCCAMTPPLGRMMLLNRVGEIILAGNAQTYELSINQFGDSFHPRGDRHLRRFELGESAVWEYQIDDITIIKTLHLHRGRDLASLCYKLRRRQAQPLQFQILPFVSLRDFHALLQHTDDFHVDADEQSMTIRRQSLAVHLRCDGARAQVQSDWWYRHTYRIETERGQDDTEDLFCPGRFVAKIDPDQREATVTLLASPNPIDPEFFKENDALRPAPVSGARRRDVADSTITRLRHAANDFIVARKRPDGSAGVTVIAGYPWFGDWGRDTMISLPGLFLATGRFEEARQVLSLYAQYVSDGMIPNRFDDYSGQPHYNTVDASLWFIHAAYEYRRLSGDAAAFEAQLYPACQAIIDGYRRGTRFNIRMDAADALITQGDENTQLTWMDAKCNGVAFTPRQGKAVEINALWHHALILTGQLELAKTCAASFGKKFWISPFRGLADVVNDGGQDRSLRPNQIFAVSLPNSPLGPEQQEAVVEVVRRELLTPFGLRTLNRDDPRYKGQYRGPQMQRDGAYHNGTVWPWLMGAFLDAYLKVNHNSPQSLAQARQWLSPLIEQLERTSIGQLHEIYEADEPHRPVGCPAQAWSIAEVLRLADRLEK